MPNEAERRELPILFSGEMVCKILSGEKTVTRRVVTDIPVDQRTPLVLRSLAADLTRRYGSEGDRFWVRERQRTIRTDTNEYGRLFVWLRYEADGFEAGPIYYPFRLQHQPKLGHCLPYGGFRESSRITLERVGPLKVEPVQAITREEAKAEGSSLDEFPGLWDSINAKRGFAWEKNPLVVRIEFRRVQP